MLTAGAQTRPRWTPQTRCHGQLEPRRVPHRPQKRPRWTPQTRCHGQRRSDVLHLTDEGLVQMHTLVGADARQRAPIREPSMGKQVANCCWVLTVCVRVSQIPCSFASWLGRSVVFVFGLVVSALRACSDFPLFLFPCDGRRPENRQKSFRYPFGS